MEKSENRLKQEKQIIEKIQKIFDNGEHIYQFRIKIDGGAGMNTRVEYRVVEHLVENDE